MIDWCAAMYLLASSSPLEAARSLEDLYQALHAVSAGAYCVPSFGCAVTDLWLRRAGLSTLASPRLYSRMFETQIRNRVAVSTRLLPR